MTGTTVTTMLIGRYLPMLNYVSFKVILIIIVFELFCLPADEKCRSIMTEKETKRNVHFLWLFK
jgi:hypothetical protein